MSIEQTRMNAYMATVRRLEPDITAIDASAFYASAAISLKRIADALDFIAAELRADADRESSGR